MHRLQELVRLHRLGVGAREVARQLQMSPNTERDYRRALELAGLLAGDATTLPDLAVLREAIETQRPALSPPPQHQSSIERWREAIETLMKAGATPTAIYDRLRALHDDFDGSLSAVKRLYRALRKAEGVHPNDVAIPVETPPGQVAQGDFGPEGGSEPAYNLSTYLGTKYKNDQDVTFITAEDGPGVADVWMTGYLDGECDINDDPIVVDVAPRNLLPSNHEPEYCGGKVSYLGGHSYLGKSGQRLFLNALFEADCVTNADWPQKPGGGDFDTDGDGVPDDGDPFPNDPNRCGDAEMDTCDDCSNGYYSPSNDGADSDGDGICDAGETAADGDGGSDSGGGCGCRTTSGYGAGLLVLAAFVLGGLTRRRRVLGRRSSCSPHRQLARRVHGRSRRAGRVDHRLSGPP